MKKFSTRILTAATLISIIMMQSCTSTKNISYFNYVPDSAKFVDPMTINIPKFTDPKIQPNDILQISVQTLDPMGTKGATMIGMETTNTYSTQGSQAPSTITGYMVNSDGEIELPLVGKIRVNGMTTKEAKALIATKAQVYYKNPVVNVRYANFVITMLGDVGQPGQYTIPNEKLTLLDAIALAGDINVTGRKEDIILGREENGEKKFVRINLNSTDFYNSPYYYLRQHDLIYVPPTKNKAILTDAYTNRTITLVAAALSLLTVGITIVTFLR